MGAKHRERAQARAIEQQKTNRGGTALLELIDRSLDKGVVIDGWIRVPVLGIEVLTVDFDVFVASCATYLEYAEAVGQTAHVVELDDALPEQLPPP